MGILHDIWPKGKFLGCGLCLVAAIVLFHKESNLVDSETTTSDPTGGALHQHFKSSYPPSENEEDIVSHIVDKLGNITRRDNIQIELVGCYLEKFFKRSQHLLLTRSVRSFTEDDAFAHGVTRQERRVVFVCYTRSGAVPAWLKVLTTQTHSGFPRRVDATDLLVVITRNPQSDAIFRKQLPVFPSQYKEVIYVDGSSRRGRFSAIQCTKKLYIAVSFGFTMSLEYPRQAPSVVDCLSDWMSVDKRSLCPRPLTKTQTVSRMKLAYGRVSTTSLYTSSDREPCFNMSFYVVFDSNDLKIYPKIPIFMDNEGEAHSFDRGVSKFERRGHVFNPTVVGVMGLLGVSLWFLSDEPSVHALLDLLCTVASSGGVPEALKNRVTIAVFLWILANTFFVQILVDDMFSSIAITDSSRIQRVAHCGLGTFYHYAGTQYECADVHSFLDWVVKAEALKQIPIMQGMPHELHRIRSFFDFRNLYRVKLENSGKKNFILINDEGFLPCPRGSLASTCQLIDSFMDHSEWNAYVSIVLRHDLLKIHFRKISRSFMSRYEEFIEKQHGFRKNGVNMSVNLSRFLAKLRPVKSDPHSAQEEIPWEFVIFGLCIATLCSVVEWTIQRIPRVWATRRAKPLRFPERSRQDDFQKPSRRAAW